MGIVLSVSAIGLCVAHAGDRCRHGAGGRSCSLIGAIDRIERACEPRHASSPAHGLQRPGVKRIQTAFHERPLPCPECVVDDDRADRPHVARGRRIRKGSPRSRRHVGDARRRRRPIPSGDQSRSQTHHHPGGSEHGGPRRHDSGVRQSVEPILCRWRTESQRLCGAGAQPGA